MILYTTIFAWLPESDESTIDLIDTGLLALAPQLPGIVFFDTGRDARLRPGTADYVIVAKFTDEQSLTDYLEHPEHQRLVGLARPMIARRESVQARL